MTRPRRFRIEAPNQSRPKAREFCKSFEGMFSRNPQRALARDFPQLVCAVAKSDFESPTGQLLQSSLFRRHHELFQ